MFTLRSKNTSLKNYRIKAENWANFYVGVYSIFFKKFNDI